MLDKEDNEVHLYQLKEPIKNNTIRLKILNDKGEVILNQNGVNKNKLFPDFGEVDFHKILINSNIINKDLFSDIEDIFFLPAFIKGKFKIQYEMLCFYNVIDCIDFEKSAYKKYVHCVPVLKGNKIPQNIDGFFLSGWHSGESWNKYRYLNIVSQKLKDKLSFLGEKSDFLIFTKLDIS
jgi:hypothetical protein